MAQAKQRFWSVDEDGKRAAKVVEEWSKWVLDILRNFVVVAVLFYLADKSGKWYLWLFAGIGGLALYNFITAYVNQSQFNFGPADGFSKVLLKLALVVVVFVITAAFTIGSIVAFYSVVKEISIMQAK